MKNQINRIDFAEVNTAARRELPALLSRWIPGGKREGNEFVARNPRRSDVSVRSGPR